MVCISSYMFIFAFKYPVDLCMFFFTHLITGIAGALYQKLLCVSSLIARMKETRGAGTSHISILWVFDKIFAVLGVIQGETLPRLCS